jgi:cell surface protein SprA
VNYQLGRVQILDASLQASNTPINVSLENNSIFGQQTRRFMGVNVEHKISDNFWLVVLFLKCLKDHSLRNQVLVRNRSIILFLDSILISLQKFLF